MFQQTIQDVLAIAEGASRPEDLLERVGSRIAAFEPFDSGEILARTPAGLLRFAVKPGLGDSAPLALAALADEPTLRLDTVAELKERGLITFSPLTSLLILRLEAPHVDSAAIVLGHARAWSFAAAPLSRIRTIASLALRLLVRAPMPAPAPEEVAKLRAEVSRLRAHGASLENEIAALRAERAAFKKGSGTPQ